VTLEDTLTKLWPWIQEKFNHPHIMEPKFTDDPEMDTAAFVWQTKETFINRGFITEIAQRMGERQAMSAVLQHEVGHYTVFPRELSESIMLRAYTEAYFKEKAESVYGFYSDMVDELRTLHFGTEDLYNLREGMVAWNLAKQDTNSATINRLLCAVYSSTHAKYASRLPELSQDEKRMLRNILNLKLTSSSGKDHCDNILNFGKEIEHLLTDKPKKRGGHGTGRDATPDLTGKNAPSIHDINVALDDILKKYGPHAYRTAKQFIGQALPEFKDPSPSNAGTSPGKLQYHDDLVPFYTRWARTYGLHIVKRPFEKDATALHPGEFKEYEVGDPPNRIDPFASRGVLCIPGITKIRRDEEDSVPAREFRVPDLNLGIDSSGSMKHPKDDSIAVLAATILGRTYHANGSLIGGWNFDTEITFVPPSRDLDAYMRLMCAYSGGGTVLNVKKLEDYLKRMKLDGTDHGYTNHDYNEIAKRLPDKRAFMDKSMVVKTPEMRKKLERLDNILITDGGIYNIAEVVEHLSGLATVTRNIIFVTTKSGYEEWKAVEGPSTFVYPAWTKEDLLKCTIGQTRKIA